MWKWVQVQNWCTVLCSPYSIFVIYCRLEISAPVASSIVQNWWFSATMVQHPYPTNARWSGVFIWCRLNIMRRGSVYLWQNGFPLHLLFSMILLWRRKPTKPPSCLSPSSFSIPDKTHLNRDKIESNLSVPVIQGDQENAHIKSFEMSPTWHVSRLAPSSL